MKRGLLFVRPKWFIVFKSFLIFAIGMGLSGCEMEAAPSSSKLEVCTPQAPNVNIYRTPPQTWTSTIFHYAATPLPPNTSPQEQQILEASYASFQHLISQTKQWSDIETIKLDTSSEVQIVVTFLSPELIQAVYLSEILRYRLFISDFEAKTQSALDSIAMRDELIFFVTVTTTNNNNMNTAAHLIDIPVKQITLMNTEDLMVGPNHDDHILDQPINSSVEPVFGYLAYPLAVTNGTNCSWVLNPIYNKSIVITVPEIIVDGVKGGPYTWMIPYSSLIHSEIPPTLPMFIVPPEFDRSQITPLQVPPGPKMNLSTPNGMDENKYWQNYARFLWHQITLGNY
jgi:hypothetical protein